MKAVRALFIVLFNVAVVAPLAASPRVPVAAWPGVSDVLLNVTVSAPAAAWPGPNDSERPGSVLVFPKFRPGLFRTVPPLPRNTFEISVTCPQDDFARSEEHTSELQSQSNLVCRLLLEKKKKII